MPEIELWRNAINILQTLGLLAVGVVMWLRKPGEQAGQDLVALRNEMLELHAGNASRVDTLEERIRHMPNSEQLAHLEGTVRTISAQNAAQSDRLTIMTTQLTRIENFLLHDAKR